MNGTSSIVAALILGALTTGCGQDANQSGSTGSGAGGSASTSAGSGGAGGQGSTSTSGSLASSSSAASTSTSATTSGSSSSGSAASGSSSSGVAKPEDCTNGVDDDQNGLTDCADPACTAGFTCAPNPPQGWLGPVALYDGPPANKPSCPADHPTLVYQGNTGILPTPAVCSACTCSSPSVTCTLGAVELDANANCTQAVGTLAQQPPGQCGMIAPPGGTQAAKIAVPTGNTSACTASLVMVTLPPPQWQTTGLACGGGGIGGGCGPKTECVPKSTAPFGAGLCVYRSGDVACPASYPTKFLYSNSVTDTRGCSACTCGAGVATCTATTSVYSGGGCAGAHVDIPNDGSCVALNGGGSMSATVTKSGACPPGGGQPTGTVVAAGLSTTVCCAP